ncbi:unnamed protein product [Prorocentrum cordatum]|uniref:Anaphase-promoting complex subunit 6 n=1 Tax=Prorocentrum cordatum TaxID=2364126 RepID=A0ABN9XD12_9DINO|nr:unnamed protein product [Polarella glacialis]|mmetsp:Transcript_113991/g.300949  ORF Transcript_113991/g.300949 Transcript_113991/m.300949 type:complete len:572 (+) Transcript_113991:92-1807(+)
MGTAYDAATVDSICRRLRGLVQEAFQRHLYTTAVFYADKLVSLKHEPEDLYTLAECYYKNGEHRRVLHLLKKHGEVTRGDARLKLLAVQSLMEAKDWDECLRYLEDVAPADSLANSDGRTGSVFALLRGRVFEALENLESALVWYERAVQLDPYCHEALDRLVGSHLLTHDREVALVSGLSLHAEDEWLRHLYAAKLLAARSGAGPDLPISASDDAASLQEHRAPGGLAPEQAASALLGAAAAERGCRAGGPAPQRPLQDEYPVPRLPPGLARNGDVLAAIAARHFCEGLYQSCYQVSKGVLEEDPYHLKVMPAHVASLVMLEQKSLVYYVAHKLVNAYPSSAVAWFAAGCYNYMVKKYEPARRFYHKALSLDHTFAPAWVAYGHAFASHDESDQALAAYRTASRLFPGSHLPWIFIGMEYVRTNSLQLAQQCLECARSLMPSDPLIYNELGVVAFQRKNYKLACDLLARALQLSSFPQEATCANLGHALLKCRLYGRALEAFQQANRLNPRSAPALTGIGFSLQLLERPEEAIEYYHRALALRRDDPVAAEMLGYAAQEAAEAVSWNMEL